MDIIEIKKKVFDFTISAVDKFLQEHPSLEFYAFAYDCMAEYGVINLCFNTESDFNKTLDSYRNGKYAKNYQTEKDVQRLKFNTGDWEYSQFETLDFAPEEEIQNLYDDFPEDDHKEHEEFIKNVLEAFCECLIDFSHSEVYKKIPKTNDFIVFCLDHDELFETGTARFEKVKARYN